MVVLTFLVMQFIIGMMLAVDVNYLAGLLGVAISTRAWFWIAGGISVTSVVLTSFLITAIYFKHERKKDKISID